MNRAKRHGWRLVAFVLGACMAMMCVRLWAQDPPTAAPAAVPAAAAPQEPPKEEAPTKADVGQVQTRLNEIWTLVAAILVFFMQAGFACVESGFTRAKNAVHVMMKNVLDFCFGSVAFWIVGFGVMFGAGTEWYGSSGWFLEETVTAAAATKDLPATFASLAWTDVSMECKYFFQLVFCATAATIVSGAMAERTKFLSYMIYSIAISAVIYPVSGHWIWGGGWLAVEKGMFDFAGSTVVHSVGGWMALVGAFVVGPRTGKYGPEGKVNAIPGHNFSLATLGVFILWLGWFGFNPGSTMGVGDATLVSHIAAVTNIAAATGVLGALFTAKIIFGKYDGTMALNGALAGLVAITCPCAWVTIGAGALIGLIAGILVVVSVIFIDKVLKIDDAVGAVSVHGVCGAWGTLSLGLFASAKWGAGGNNLPKIGLFCEGGNADQLMAQAWGVFAILVWCLVAGGVLFYALKYTLGLRVPVDEERQGLDFGEHGNEAYAQDRGAVS